MEHKEGTMRKILVIDDEELICWSLSKELSKNGYMVDSALSGRDGMEMMKCERYDLVITDLKLPDISGFDMVTSAKAIMPDIKVVVMSSYEWDADKVDFLKRYTSGFLTKPVSPSLLNSLMDMVFMGDSSFSNLGMGIKFYSYNEKIHDILNSGFSILPYQAGDVNKERRRFERYSVDFDVVYALEKHFIHAKVSDLSKDGAFVKTGISLEVGSPIDIDFYLSGNNVPVCAIGKVVRTSARKS